MLDILLFGIIAWSGLVGMIFGGRKTITYLSILVGSLISMWVIIPGVKESIEYSSLKNIGKLDIPATSKRTLEIMANTLKQKIQHSSGYLYVRSMYFIGIISVISGIFLVQRSVVILHLDGIKSSYEKWMGVGIGLGVGIYMDAIVVKSLGLGSVSYMSLQHLLSQSIIASMWFRIMGLG